MCEVPREKKLGSFTILVILKRDLTGARVMASKINPQILCSINLFFFNKSVSCALKNCTKYHFTVKVCFLSEETRNLKTSQWPDSCRNSLFHDESNGWLKYYLL